MGQEFNKYMDATFDYLDQRLANSIKVNETFNSKMFRQEMHQAFLRKTDPIDFVEDFIRDQQSWGMGEAAGAGQVCPECKGAGFSIGGPDGQYDECPNCTDPKTGATLPPERWKSTASDAGSRMGGLTHGYDSIASVFGKKSEALGDGGDQSARGSAQPIEWDFDVAGDAFDEEYLRYLADQYGVQITGINPNGPGGGNPQIFASARDRETALRFMKGLYGEEGGATDADYGLPDEDEGEGCEVCGKTGGNPSCKYCRDAEKEMGRAEHMFGQNEAHGERAQNRGPTNGRAARVVQRQYNEPKVARKDFQNTKSPDFGSEPDDQMFFGEPDQEDAVGTMIDPQSPSDEFKGQKVQDFSSDSGDEPGFGDSSDDFLDTSHVSDDDVDSIWGPEGKQELPGSDVQFPEYDPDDQAEFNRKDWQGKGDPWYGKSRPKLNVGKDIRTTPDRKGIGDDERYTGDRFVNFMDKGWRKAMGYDESIKQDRGSAADAHRKDIKKKREDSDGFRTEKGGHFEVDPNTGDLKRS